MRSLPLTLVARLLPVAVLTGFGVAMTTSADSDSGPEPAASDPSPSSKKPSASVSSAEPPAKPCATLPAATLGELVPKAKPSGNELTVSDISRRTGCSWHALDGFDYRWLDISYDVSGKRVKASGGSATPVPGLGDEATISQDVTTEGGQGTREAIVVVRDGPTLVTVTYNGSDFESKKAPEGDTIRKGALTAAKQAVAALD